MHEPLLVRCPSCLARYVHDSYCGFPRAAAKACGTPFSFRSSFRTALASRTGAETRGCYASSTG
jgi:hypothetical protein